jgi:nucleotide-binding universal stress UspA family protein
MIEVTNILWLADFSEDSLYALGYARALAELFKTKLYLLHVIDNPASTIYGRVEKGHLTVEAHAREQTWQWLQAAVQRELTNYFTYEVLVQAGEVLTKIVQTAREKEIGTIVMGTHGRSGLAHLVLGSVAEQVVRSAPCPVYVVPHPHRRAVALE